MTKRHIDEYLTYQQLKELDKIKKDLYKTKIRLFDFMDYYSQKIQSTNSITELEEELKTIENEGFGKFKERMKENNEEIKKLQKLLKTIQKQNEVCEKLMKINLDETARQYIDERMKILKNKK